MRYNNLKYIITVLMIGLLLQSCSDTGSTNESSTLNIKIILPVEVNTDKLIGKQPRKAIILPAGVSTFIVTVRDNSNQIVATGQLTASGTINLTVPADIELSVTVEALDASQAWLFSGTTYNVTASAGSATNVDVVLGTPSPQNILGNTGDQQVQLSWIGLTSNNNQHNLYWSLSPGVTTSDNKILVNGTTYTHSGLTNNTTYYYAVSAENSAGETALSKEVMFTPPDNTPPLKPLAPTSVTSYYSCDDPTGIGSNYLNWQAAERATHYRIYQNGSQIGSSNTTSWTHTDVNDSSSYSYTVTALNAGGESLSSETTQVITGICDVYICETCY